MKRTIIITVAILFIILVVPLTMVLVGFCTPPQFSETYYGELSHMYTRLKTTEGKKIVLIGNSSVAFNVRSDLLEDEFPDYKVVNFGLYGAIGTKTMMDLSRAHIHEGDIVIVMPEPIAQSMSLYFSASDVWKAVDSDYSILSGISSDNMPSMIGNFAAYTADKFKYFSSGELPNASGVYTQAAFNDASGNEVGYMTYDRPYNVMLGGYDTTTEFSLDSSVLSDEFASYLNEYNDYITNQKATLYFGFVPVNELVVEGDTKEYYSHLKEKLDFGVLGHPAKYLMDYRWFYDIDVHLNSAGMYAYTDTLAEDLKLEMGINTPNKIVVPEKPEVPIGEVGTGNNIDASLFTYEIVSNEIGKHILLTGLTEEGKARAEIIVPTTIEGIAVREFCQSVFAGNTSISKITLPGTIARIRDNSFAGCTRLSMLIFEHNSILGINAGANYLDGAPNCYIYLKRGISIAGCAGGWERYQDRIVYY